jgi:hypothetical protein
VHHRHHLLRLPARARAKQHLQRREPVLLMLKPLLQRKELEHPQRKELVLPKPRAKLVLHHQQVPELLQLLKS